MSQTRLLIAVAIVAAVFSSSITALVTWFVGPRTAAVQAIVDDYMTTRAESVFTAVVAGAQHAKQRQQQERQAKVATLRAEIEGDARTPFLGNPKGDVTIVEFSDYNCGFCRSVAPVVRALVNEDKNLRVVVREFPILGPESLESARAALAVFAIAPEKYAAFHLALFAGPSRASKAQTLGIAKAVGIDSARLSVEMSKTDHDTAIANTHKLAETLGINGTPAFIVNDELVPGAMDLSQLRARVAAARAPKASAVGANDNKK